METKKLMREQCEVSWRGEVASNKSLDIRGVKAVLCRVGCFGIGEGLH